MNDFFKNIWKTLRLIFVILLFVVIALLVGYLLGNRALDRDKLEDEIRTDIENSVRDDLEEDIRSEYEDRLEQAEKLREEELQNMIDALLDDIDARVNGIDTESQLEEFNEEIEFGIE